MKYAVIFVIIAIAGLLFFVSFTPITKIPVPFLGAMVRTDTISKSTTILLGGDIMLGRSVTVQSLDVKHDPLFPFRNISNLFDQSDIVFVNLENPIIDGCPRRTDGMIFCAPPEMLQGLLGNKTIVNLANNHSANYGTDGITKTRQYLSEKGIETTESLKLVRRTVNGTTFGFLGFDKDQQSNPVLTDNERQFINESRAKVDVLIAAMHWGIEYNAHPTTAQKKLAEDLSALGVNIIVGHHPHWVQDVESIGTTKVYYSLGNLVFDQTWSEETKKGLLVKLTFNGNKLENQELIQTYIKQIGQPIIIPSPKE